MDWSSCRDTHEVSRSRHVPNHVHREKLMFLHLWGDVWSHQRPLCSHRAQLMSPLACANYGLLRNLLQVHDSHKQGREIGGTWPLPTQPNQLPNSWKCSLVIPWIGGSITSFADHLRFVGWSCIRKFFEMNSHKPATVQKPFIFHEASHKILPFKEG